MQIRDAITEKSNLFNIFVTIHYNVMKMLSRPTFFMVKY